jgi:hypothetical protein
MTILFGIIFGLIAGILLGYMAAKEIYKAFEE